MEYWQRAKKSRFLFEVYSSTIKRKKNKIKFHENLYSSTMIEYWQEAKGRHDLSSSYSTNFFDWKLVRRDVYVNCRWRKNFDSMAWIENSFKRVYKYKCVYRYTYTHTHINIYIYIRACTCRIKGRIFEWLSKRFLWNRDDTFSIPANHFRSRWKFNVGWESLMILSFERDSIEWYGHTTWDWQGDAFYCTSFQGLFVTR